MAGDIIYGYCVGDWACTAGSGFTARSTLDGNLIEDMLAGSAGSYAATGSATNGWTMQMVALKSASAPLRSRPQSASLSPASLTFASQAVGTTSAAQISHSEQHWQRHLEHHQYRHHGHKSQRLRANQ